jgi:predicted amidophosphoribosyltransferase
MSRHLGASPGSYPPPKNRFATVRRICEHCGLPADTREPTCPVCGTRYPPSTRLGRLLRRLRS